MPSPLKSPTTRGNRKDEANIGGWKPPSPSPRRTAKPPGHGPEHATATSIFPSLLKSPTSTLEGEKLRETEDGVPNEPFPVPRATDSEFEPWSAVTKSCLPSPLKSADAMETGLVPTEKSGAPRKAPVPLPSRMETKPWPEQQREPAITRSSLWSRFKSPATTEKAPPIKG